MNTLWVGNIAFSVGVLRLSFRCDDYVWRPSRLSSWSIAQFKAVSRTAMFLFLASSSYRYAIAVLRIGLENRGWQLKKRSNGWLKRLRTL